VDSTEVVLHVDGLNTVNVSINGGDDELWHCYTPAASTPLLTHDAPSFVSTEIHIRHECRHSYIKNLANCWEGASQTTLEPPLDWTV